VPAHGGRGVGNDGVVFPAADVVVQHHPSRGSRLLGNSDGPHVMVRVVWRFPACRSANREDRS
jgi:hypothetical protein